MVRQSIMVWTMWWSKATHFMEARRQNVCVYMRESEKKREREGERGQRQDTPFKGMSSVTCLLQLGPIP
jgi:hypothetical protein